MMEVSIFSVFDDLKATVEEFQGTIPVDKKCVLRVCGQSIRQVKKISNELIAYIGDGQIIIQHINQTDLHVSVEPRASDEPAVKIGFRYE